SRPLVSSGMSFSTAVKPGSLKTPFFSIASCAHTRGTLWTIARPTSGGMTRPGSVKESSAAPRDAASSRFLSCCSSRSRSAKVRRLSASCCRNKSTTSPSVGEIGTDRERRIERLVTYSKSVELKVIIDLVEDRRIEYLVDREARVIRIAACFRTRKRKL